jgi:uncharacterized protein YcbX
MPQLDPTTKPTPAAKAGVIASIHRYPVKSMMGEELNATCVKASGVEGDRAFALKDTETGKVASAKNPSKWPSLFQFRAAFAAPLNGNGSLPPVRITLPDGEMVTSEDRDAEGRISASLGRQVQLLKGAPAASSLEEYWPDIDDLARRDVVTDEAMPAETFFDCATIHILTTATLKSLQSLYPQGRFEARRFRPNFVIETDTPAGSFPENEWHEKTLAIGNEVKIRITGPCGRCVMTTLSQSDLPKDTDILKTAAKHNQARVGVYAEVVQGGTVRRGDAVQLI